jgi:hypothetical protein
VGKHMRYCGAIWRAARVSSAFARSATMIA